MSQHTVDLVKTRLGQLFEELLVHDGYADLSVEMRILKRGQKEVVIRCGKQYRYVVDVPASSPGDTLAPGLRVAG